MIKCFTEQALLKNKNLSNYGFDKSGKINYHFDEYGFRNNNYNIKPNLIIFGGSIVFGIGIEKKYTLGDAICTILNKTHWNLSYANYYYDNQIIYETIKSTIIPTSIPILVQWVSDKRNNSNLLYQYILEIKDLFTNSIHFLNDARETKSELNRQVFSLVNPKFIDIGEDGIHPGKKTNLGLARYFIKHHFSKIIDF
jgi:hypothetical protein